jgi:nuclear pore complex protein Nup188
MNGVTTIYAIPCHVAENVNYGHQIESHHPVNIPGIEGIKVPRGTNGYILKVLQEDAVLVRWEVDLCATILHICLRTSTFVFGLNFIHCFFTPYV